MLDDLMEGDETTLSDGTPVVIEKKYKTGGFIVEMLEESPCIARSWGSHFWGTKFFYNSRGEFLGQEKECPTLMPKTYNKPSRFYVGTINENGELVSHAADNL